MIDPFETYIAPEIEIITLCFEAPVMGESDGVPGWGGEGAGDEQKPGF